MPKMKGKFKHRKIPRWILIAALVLLMLAAYVFIEPYWLVTTEYEVYNTEIPSEFDGFEIVFVSDIHHGPFFSYDRVENLRDKINNIGADIVLLGGDYVHRGPAYVAPVFEALKGLAASGGVYGVLGNHDHWDGEQATRDGFTIAGITDIENKRVVITKGESLIHIAGVGDFDMGFQEYSREDDIFSILVSHNPDYAAELAEDKPELMLCGHTHAGQVTLFGLWAPLIPSKYGNKFRYGEISYNDIKMIVTSGVGTITPPVRFFARPEIVKITLRSGDEP
jgi:predicted MPP superfamily phosphohydrolase